MNKRLLLKLFIITILLMITLSAETLAAPGDENQVLAIVTTRVSVASDGIQGNGESYYPSISADGRYVAFDSSASNLVSGDTNDGMDVFVHDRETSTTTVVSVASDGTQGNSHSGAPSISADGRYVAFQSRANNLVGGDTNDGWDVFVHDRQTGTTTIVSVASDGTQGNGYSSLLQPAISANGRYVAFSSDANNLVSGDTNNADDIFVHDRDTGTTTIVSVASDGTQANWFSYTPAISADGRYVAFDSIASNLVSGDDNFHRDVFVHDRQTSTTTIVSVASDGTQGNEESNNSSISADGRYVAISSDASNLVSGDTNNEGDVFVHDRQTGTTTRVSVASDGTQGNYDSGSPCISADGRFVAFGSSASNLVSGDNNNYSDVFVRDRLTGITTIVSVASDGTQGNDDRQYDISISADGCCVAFNSLASNLVSGDTNNAGDIFVRGDEIPPSLTINYTNGAPGSYFNIHGSHFPSNQNASVTINGTLLGNVTTSEAGAFIITLSTGNADEGSYYITVSVNPQATTKFTLSASDPIRPKEGSYAILDVPAGIAYTDEIFLPILSR